MATLHAILSSMYIYIYTLYIALLCDLIYKAIATERIFCIFRPECSHARLAVPIGCKTPRPMALQGAKRPSNDQKWELIAMYNEWIALPKWWNATKDGIIYLCIYVSECILYHFMKYGAVVLGTYDTRRAKLYQHKVLAAFSTRYWPSEGCSQILCSMWLWLYHAIISAEPCSFSHENHPSHSTSSLIINCTPNSCQTATAFANPHTIP